MSAPVEPKKSDNKQFSFTSQYIATPQTTKLEEMNSKYLDGKLGLLKIKVLAVHIQVRVEIFNSLRLLW